MNRKYSIFLVIIVLVLIGIFLWKTTNKTNQSSQANKTNQKQVALPKEVVVQLDKNGFSPKEVTIKVGSAVRWKNITENPQTVNSDDYPTNQLHKELNFGVFAPGSTLVYIFMQPGIYGYHNQFNHEQKGKIIVTQ